MKSIFLVLIVTLISYLFTGCSKKSTPAPPNNNPTRTVRPFVDYPNFTTMRIGIILSEPIQADGMVTFEYTRQDSYDGKMKIPFVSSTCGDTCTRYWQDIPIPSQSHAIWYIIIKKIEVYNGSNYNFTFLPEY